MPAPPSPLPCDVLVHSLNIALLYVTGFLGSVMNLKTLRQGEYYQAVGKAKWSTLVFLFLSGLIIWTLVVPTSLDNRGSTV